MMQMKVIDRAVLAAAAECRHTAWSCLSPQCWDMVTSGSRVQIQPKQRLNLPEHPDMIL